MTRNATEFIGPHTFESLTGNRVSVDTFDRNDQFQVEHIALADQADLVLVAPATANVLAKLAHGLADDMLTTTILAGAAGSGTGGLAIALENLAPQYLEMGISAEVLHRIGCLSAIDLDSLPHNGAVVVLLTLAGMTHKESYKQIFVTTVVLTVIVAAIGIALATVMY